MSKIIKMVGLLALVAAFGLANTAVASPPVPPPVEGFSINTDTIIDCFGTVVENDAFTWTYGTGNFDVTTLTMGATDSAGQIRYEENFSAVDGSTMLNKEFTAYSHIDDAPNLYVDKGFGYVGDTTSLVAALDESEKVGIGVVTYGYVLTPDDIGGLESICPWVSGGTDVTIPATNEFVSMGSTVKTGVNLFADTPAIVVSKETSATTTLSPALSHEVTGGGYGEITAWMAVHLQEGADVWDPADPVPQLITETRYTRFTSAEGIINNFQKEMTYTASIPALPTLTTWDSLFD